MSMRKPPVSDQRIAFEAWYKGSHFDANLIRTQKGYIDNTTRVAWRAWQAAQAAAEKQEPVAWRLNGTSSLGHGKVFGDWKSGSPPKDVTDLASADKNWSLEFAYTTPPAAQRTWVGLTDEEIEDIHCTPPKVRPRGKFPFARMIEAKLKEKNT